jgi:hypothetical protein
MILALHFGFIDSGMHYCGFVKLVWSLSRLFFRSFANFKLVNYKTLNAV